MYYAYDIFGCIEEGNAVLSIYRIEQSYITSVKRMKCTKDLSERIFRLDQKGRQRELRHLYGG